MVSQDSSSSVITRSLLEEISSGRLKPGDNLPSEQEIMNRHSVSRAVARDVTLTLTGMGVVERSQGRRGRIQKLDSSRISELFPLMLTMGDWNDVRQVYELRMAIEAEAAAMAARKATDAQIEEIARLASDYAQQHLSRGVDEENIEDAGFVDLDFEFHRAICEACGNGMFTQLLDVLSSFLKYVQVESCREDKVRGLEASKEHLRLVDALKNRDPERARLEMTHHLIVSCEVLAEKLKDSE